MLRWIILAVVCVASTSAEVLLETSFDLSHTTETDTGYTAEDTLNSWLDSDELKWLRFYKVSISAGYQEGTPMRVAHMMFKDLASWAKFEEDHKVKTHALLDYFWLSSRRVLLKPVSSNIKFPVTARTEEKVGGFIFQLKYTIQSGKVGEFNTQWARLAPFFATTAGKNQGFMERAEYSAAATMKSGQMVVNYEFSDMPSLVELMHSKTYQDIVKALQPLCSTWYTEILTPGDQEGLYFPGKGADPGEGEE